MSDGSASQQILACIREQFQRASTHPDSQSGIRWIRDDVVLDGSPHDRDIAGSGVDFSAPA